MKEMGDKLKALLVEDNPEDSRLIQEMVADGGVMGWLPLRSIWSAPTSSRPGWSGWLWEA